MRYTEASEIESFERRLRNVKLLDVIYNLG